MLINLLSPVTECWFGVGAAARACDVALALLHHVLCMPDCVQSCTTPHKSRQLLQGIGKDVPVTADSRIADFQCCFFEAVYRQHVVVQNAASNAAKVAASLPSAVASLLDVSPAFAFVQAGSSLAFNVTLCAPPDAMQSCGKYLQPSSDGATAQLAVPLKLMVTGQTEPLRVTLQAQLTTPALCFEPATLDFGRCLIGETAVAAVQLRNSSALPQTFAFLELPRGLEIEGDGVGVVEAQAICELQLRFTPELAGAHSFKLACSTLALHTYHLSCKAEAGTPPLRLSHNRVAMAATHAGDTACASVVLHNESTEKRVFAFQVPRQSHVELTPAQGSLAAGQAVRIQIEHQPPSTSSSSGAVHADRQAAAATDQTADDVQQRGGATAAAPSGSPQLESCDIPCHVCTKGNAAAERRQLHLSVETCTLAPKLQLEGVELDNAEQRCFRHAFGPAAIGAKAMLTISVHNLDSKQHHLVVQPLDISGAFQQVNASRAIAAGASQALKLQFCPPCPGVFCETACVSLGGHSARIELSGSGLAPQLKLASEHASGHLDLGDVLASEQAQKVVTLQNEGSFAIACTLRFRQHGLQNAGSSPVLFAQAERLTVPAHDLAQVPIVFAPDWQVRGGPTHAKQQSILPAAQQSRS